MVHSFYGAYPMLILDLSYYESFDESIFALRMRLFFSTMDMIDLLCLLSQFSL